MCIFMFLKGQHRKTDQVQGLTMLYLFGIFIYSEKSEEKF